MDYKNLYLRTISSFFIILMILVILFSLDNYISYFISIIYIIIFYEVFTNFNKKNLIFIISIIYLIISFFSSIYYFFYLYNQTIFLFFILIIVLFDTSSYLFGILLGKKKIFPKISPNKTYIGYLGGIFSTIFICYIINIFINIFNDNKLFIFILMIIIFSFIGDIIESFFKRNSNIKDSSNFIPGHGGFFDRFDSFILSFASFSTIYYFL